MSLLSITLFLKKIGFKIQDNIQKGVESTMPENTDRMTFSIFALLVGGGLLGILLTPNLPGIMGLEGAVGMNFLQWIFSLIGTKFETMINIDTIKKGATGSINLFGTIASRFI